jgi:putative transcriptional regulator
LCIVLDYIGSPVSKLMIEWRLHVVMAERRMTPSELSEKMGVNRVSVSRLKNSEKMPRLHEETLNKLCNILECQPGDLIRFTPDEPE